MSAAAPSLEEILDRARLPEREVSICLDGTVVREHEEALRELSLLVDADGNVLATGDGGLTDADIAAAQAKADHVHELRQRLRGASQGFRFRAMSSQDCEAFERRHRRDQGKGTVRDQRAYENELISTCAVRPQMSIEDVEGRLRTHLNQRQITSLINTATIVNSVDGGVPALGPAPKVILGAETGKSGLGDS